MREIKFRGKRTDNGEWVYGFLIKTKFVDDENCVCEWVYSIQSEHINNGSYYRYMDYEIETLTLGQFTGLFDKNGVGIFEGDILSGKYKIEIVFKDGMFCGKQIGINNYSPLVEWGLERNVIGNIHEVSHE